MLTAIIGNPNVASLLAAVRSEPENWDLRRVLADALEEAGLGEAANGHRYQAREQKCPLYDKQYYQTWDWWTERAELYGVAHNLDRLMFSELGDWLTVQNLWRGWATCDAAEAALASALVKIGIWVRGDE
jgi:hypothetical protein